MVMDYDVGRRLALFPDTARLQGSGDAAWLEIAGCSLPALAEQYGTPLYLYDQATMDHALRAYRQALSANYPGSWGITYAAKAFLCRAVGQWANQRDVWIDCSSAREVAIAAAGGMERQGLVVHGVNKGAADLEAGLTQAGTLVVDNATELDRVRPLAARQEGPLPDLWLRLRPGMAVETHAYNQTGQEASKFGMNAAEVSEAVHLCLEEGLPLTGLHFHLGSQFRDPAPVVSALDVTLDLMASLRERHDWTPRTICPGGGWGVAYNEEDLPQPSIEDYVTLVAQHINEGCRRRELPLPRLQLEPGRSLVARAGVAVYQVGTVKQTAGRHWVLVDGGLADNARPALYGSRYSALPVQHPERPGAGPVWIAGPYCESGDVLIQDINLPDVQPGELLAIPVSGAYQLSMANNYNGALRPAVLWVQDGEACAVQLREQPEDLQRRDRPLPASILAAVP